MFYRDEGDSFDAPAEVVWAFVSSRDAHSAAHRHEEGERISDGERAGTYHWVQPFRGRRERFGMRWRSYYPVGVAYDVVAGPFEGSRFFLLYEPKGNRTAVEVVGDFVSSTIPSAELAAAVDSFFTLEFEQDRAGIAAFQAREGTVTRPGEGRGPSPADPRTGN